MGEGGGGGETSVPFPLTSILSHQGRGGIFQVNLKVIRISDYQVVDIRISGHQAKNFCFLFS